MPDVVSSPLLTCSGATVWVDSSLASSSSYLTDLLEVQSRGRKTTVTLLETNEGKGGRPEGKLEGGRMDERISELKWGRGEKRLAVLR